MSLRDELEGPGRFADHDARQIETLAGAQRYSAFVRSMRVVLPVLALSTLGAIVLWPSLAPHAGGIKLSYARVDTTDSDLRMVAPRLNGRDQANRPFTVTADEAVPDKADPNRLHLEHLDGDMTEADGTWLNLTAPRGVYDKFLKRLNLEGPVAFHTDQGFEINARSALVDLALGAIVTEEPVALQGPFGTLEADNAHVSERGRHTVFDGHVRGQLSMTKGGKS